MTDMEIIAWMMGTALVALLALTAWDNWPDRSTSIASARESLTFGKHHFIEHRLETVKHSECWGIGRIASGQIIFYALSRQEALDFMAKADELCATNSGSLK